MSDTKIPYIIKGARVGLAALDKAYLKDMQVSINEIETAILTAQIPPFTIEDEEVFYTLSDKKSLIVFAIHELKSNQFIGTMTLSSIDYINGTAEDGGMLSPEFRHKGYGTEALLLLCDYGFSVLNLQMIWGRAFSYNLDMYNVAKKIGFKDGGKIRSYKRVAGETYGLHINTILADEFYAHHPSRITDLVKQRIHQ